MDDRYPMAVLEVSLALATDRDFFDDDRHVGQYCDWVYQLSIYERTKIACVVCHLPTSQKTATSEQ